jgi:arginyl-tRNA synthetase
MSHLSSSSLLDRLARDLPALRVEAVTPRRIGAFRARLPDDTSPVALRHAADRLGRAPWIRGCVSVPPNLYFDLEPDRLATLIAEELTPERRFGYLADAAPRAAGVSLAFCSPNANKPLHLGHARNMLLGAAIGNLLELSGARVFRSCCLSDYGTHIFKAQSAYLRCGGASTPESAADKGDHFVGRYYARFAADPALAHGPDSPQQLSARWMRGDPDVRALTRRLTAWAESGFDETFEDWAIRFDHRFYETEEQAYIDRFVAEQRARGTVREDEQGRLVVDLDTDPPQAVALARSDGSPLYMSHMVAAILQRLDTFGASVATLLTLTGEEQVVPFGQLGHILARFGYATGVELRHRTHGMVRAGGAGLSSRAGTALTLDDVVKELADAHAGIDEDDELAAVRARATLALYVLGRQIDKPLDFSIDQCLLAGGRVLRDAAETLRATRAPSPGPRPRAFRRRADTDRFERWSARLAAYPLALDQAVSRLDPSLLANHLAGLCHDFVLLRRASGDDEHAPLRDFARLFAPTRRVVEHALGLLTLDPDGVARLDAAMPPSRACAAVH